jgi:hypothetical protein
MNSPVDSRDFLLNFRRFIRLRNAFLVLWLGFLPAAMIFLGKREALTSETRIASALLFIWFVSFCYVGFRLVHGPCPRCGKRFIGQRWHGLDLAAWQCNHCGLARTRMGD